MRTGAAPGTRNPGADAPVLSHVSRAPDVTARPTSGHHVRPRPRLRHACALAALAGLLPVTSSLAQQRPDADIAPAARAYLATALDSLERTAMRRGTTDWKAVRDSAFLLAAGAQAPSDTWAALGWALRRVDRHSFLQVRWPWVAPALVAGRYGYLRIPSHQAGSKLALADSLQAALRDLEARGACGWLLDLRMNGGGNVWPMLAGIGPLLGDSLASVAFEDGAVVERSLYVDGEAIHEERGERTVLARVEAAPYAMARPGAPVAVLIDGGTASSAEMVAIAFRPRPATRFFGMPTAGYTTGNRGVRLADGANMVVTVGAMTDREGRAYAEALVPDERVPMPEGYGPPVAVDATARRAAAWLAEQPACRVAR